MAPPLDIETWVKGTAVDAFESDKLYIVEFWATWCGPCRMSMPHLSGLQDKHVDEIAIVGVSNEKEEEVTKFLEAEHESGRTWDEVITYTIAVDHENATTNAYMKAAQARGIPTAFVVGRDGMIEWIGHPMELDPILPQIAAGDWDRDAARQKRAASLAKEAEEMEVMQIVMTARANKDYDEAITAIDTLLAKYPDDLNYQANRFRLLIESERFDEAIQMLQAVDASNPDNRDVLNFMAWSATNTHQTPLLEAAREVMQQLHDASEPKDASLIDTLARVHFALGELDQAIAWQEQAVTLDDKPALQARLEEYRKALADQSSDDADHPAQDEAPPAESAAPLDDDVTPAEDATTPQDTAPPVDEPESTTSESASDETRPSE
jgi:thiol-disulfide isomerase/thioredoxin